jgi:hypothetical protein
MPTYLSTPARHGQATSNKHEMVRATTYLLPFYRQKFFNEFKGKNCIQILLKINMSLIRPLYIKKCLFDVACSLFILM